MKFLHWLKEEAKSLLSVTLYFAACFMVVMILKQLLLAEYGIAFSGITTAVVVALVTAKVVIVLQKVPLTRWLRGQPAILDVLVRSTFYTLTTVAALLLERAFESRAEHGGFAAAVVNVLEHRDVAQVWATAICVGLAFLAYNAFGVVRRELGGAWLWRLFFRKADAGQARQTDSLMRHQGGSPL